NVLRASVMVLSFKLSLELRQRAQARALEFSDPALRDGVDRHRIDVVQLLAALALRRHEIGLLQDGEMLRHRLACHVQTPTQLSERLPILRVQPVQQPPAAGIRERAKNGVVRHAFNMQPFSCLSSGAFAPGSETLRRPVAAAPDRSAMRSRTWR